MKKFAFLPLAAFVFAAACADTPTASAPDAASFTQGISGPTFVTGVFNISGSSVGGTAGVNSHPQGKGTCRNAAGQIAPPAGGAEYTYWHAPGASEATTGAKFCQGTTGDPDVISCTFEVPATYARGSDNQNLNFDVTYAVTGTDLFVHWTNNRDRLRGRGTIEVETECEDESTPTIRLDLTQFASNQNKFIGDTALNTAGVNVTNGGTYRLLSLTWDLRSGVGAN